MRFKAKLSSEKLSVVQGVVSTLEKIGARSVLHLSPSQLNFAVLHDATSGSEVLAFSELHQQEVFMEWRIESLSENCILLELGLQNLLDALNSARNSPLCQLKLTKRQGKPALSLETRALEVDVIHDIPVKTMKVGDYEYYRPPDVPVPQVQLELPTSKGLKTVVDRLKTISRNVYIHGEMAGTLTIRSATDKASIQTFFQNLRPRSEALEGFTENQATVKVDTKKLATVLQSYSLRFNTIILCLIEGYSLVLHVLLDPPESGTLTFYLPVLALEEEDIWA